MVQFSRTIKTIVVLVAFICFVQISIVYAQGEGEPSLLWKCTIPPTTEGGESTIVTCSEYLSDKCVDITTLSPRCDSTDPATVPCTDSEPKACELPQWKCRPNQAATIGECTNNIRTSWVETPVADSTTLINFSRLVECYSLTYLNTNVEVTGCVDTEASKKPIATTQATIALSQTQCLVHNDDTTAQAVYDPCPTVTAFTTDYAAQLKFCSGLSTSITQQCQFSITAAGDEFVFQETRSCTESQTVALVCPIFKPTCSDKYAIEPPEKEEEEEEPKPFSLLKDDDDDDEKEEEEGKEEEERNEMDAATCKLATPTCATCTADVIPLITSFSNPSPALQVHCYLQQPNPNPPIEEEPTGTTEEEPTATSEEDDDDKFIWVLQTNLDENQYKLCLRAGGFTVDPATVQPAQSCENISTCTYYKCANVDNVFSFENCYDEDVIEALPCQKTQSYPICLGSVAINAECYIGDDKQANTQSCESTTTPAPPQLKQECEPTTCPKFTWTTDAINENAEDSDFGEEETTSDMFVVTGGTNITASLENVEFPFVLPWSLNVYARTVVYNADKTNKTYSYSKIEKYSQSLLYSPTVTFEVSVEHSPIDSYFVVRAEWGQYEFIHEDSSGECEELPIDIQTQFYPPNPTCTPPEPEQEPTKVVVEEEEVSHEDHIQRTGREKLAIVQAPCRLQFGENCRHGSLCQPAVVDGQTTHKCSSCFQAFSGPTCSVCNLTDVCVNGSTPFGPTESPNQFQFLDNEEKKSDEYKNQCHCLCTSKNNAGASCGCNAVYIRLDFKSQLTLRPGQSQEDWVIQLARQISSFSKLYVTVFTPYTSVLSSTQPNSNYVVYQIAACANNVTPQMMVNSVMSALQQDADDYTVQQVNDGLEVYRNTGDAHSSPAFEQAGGLYAISKPYDPQCTGTKCNPDVTSSTYVAPKDTLVKKGGLSGGIIFLIIILTILGIAAVGCLIFLLVCVCCLGKRNKNKNFGSSKGGDSEMYATEVV